MQLIYHCTFCHCHIQLAVVIQKMSYTTCHCHTQQVTVIFNLPLSCRTHHCHIWVAIVIYSLPVITYNLPLPHYHMQLVIATLSHTPCHCHIITYNLPLPRYHIQIANATLSYGTCQCHIIIWNLPMPHYHIQQARLFVWGQVEEIREALSFTSNVCMLSQYYMSIPTILTNCLVYDIPGRWWTEMTNTTKEKLTSPVVVRQPGTKTDRLADLLLIIHARELVLFR